jgi:hypothetical protein
LSRSKTEVIFFLTIILYIDTSQSERSDFSRSSKASPFRPPWDSKAASARRGYHSRRRLVLREMEEGMIIALYIAAAVIMAVGSLYFAWRNRDFRKFLAGAFFVSSGILFYLYLADISVPLLETSFVETPQISGARSIVHFILFLLCFYFGFVRKPKA